MPNNETETTEKKKRGRKKPDLIRLTTRLTDGEFAQSSRVWCGLVKKNIADFSALDPNINIAYCNTWMAEIEAFEALPNDEVKGDEQQTQLQRVEEARKAFFEQVDVLQFYVRKAYPTEPFRIAEFGLTRIRSQANKRGVRDVVIGFAMRMAIDTHLAELLAAGMPAAFPSDFENALGNYADQEVKHQYCLLDAVRATHTRILAFNNLYRKHRHIVEAAEVVYAGDKIKIDLYR